MRKELEYLTHSEILGKIEVMQRNAKQLSSKFGVDHLLFPHVAQVHRAAEEEQNPHQLHQQHVRFAHKPPSSKKKHVHDSWSSRASSILNNPESIYVSREEVLKNLQNDNHALRGSKTKQERSKAKQQQHRHGSWSSRASSILASANQKEPNYMSRAEIIENLADAAYDALSRRSSNPSLDDESDSDASTVKSVIMNMKRRDQARKADAAKFPPPSPAPDPAAAAAPYSGGDSDTCSCTSCELYYMGDGYCSTCDGDYGGYGYDDDNIYGVGNNGNGNLTYTKEPSNAKYSAPISTRRDASSKTASTDSGGKAAGGRDKGKRNGSVSSSSNGARANMNNVAEAAANSSSRE